MFLFFYGQPLNWELITYIMDYRYMICRWGRAFRKRTTNLMNNKIGRLKLSNSLNTSIFIELFKYPCEHIWYSQVSGRNKRAILLKWPSLRFVKLEGVEQNQVLSLSTNIRWLFTRLKWHQNCINLLYNWLQGMFGVSVICLFHTT